MFSLRAMCFLQLFTSFEVYFSSRFFALSLRANTIKYDTFLYYQNYVLARYGEFDYATTL
jgi:hypothetical protein